MAALPPVPGVAKVIIKQNIASVNVYNVMHVAAPVAAAWTAGGLAGLAGAIRNAWVTNVIPLQSVALTLTDVQCIDLSSDTGEEGTVTGNTPGTLGSTTMPASAAICWSWKIARRYRGGHPRTYIAGVASAQLTNPNTITAPAITSHINAANALRVAINSFAFAGGTARLVCVHYTRSKVILGAPLVSDITGANVDSRLDSQRRRLGKDRT